MTSVYLQETSFVVAVLDHISDIDAIAGGGGDHL
jgi:hypothetical protein